MKKALFFLPLLLVFTAGCLSNKSGDPAPDPSGTFKGEFRRITRGESNSIDTVKTDIVLTITPGVGYSVTGDTLTVHAGSKGHYGISGNGIMFVDDTYPKTGMPEKAHLNGEYLFLYNGSVFQMVRSTGDTLSLQYDLKKVN
ncbi:hypothetical protein ACFQZX_04465 [Mucilaginibacter litoreus]|uniref:Lipoprotein n=1 Tax=Mucilaginibacter litoreus TaxID=1048221 RepID=A0ABW3AQT7_9SPHI